MFPLEMKVIINWVLEELQSKLMIEDIYHSFHMKMMDGIDRIHVSSLYYHCLVAHKTTPRAVLPCPESNEDEVLPLEVSEHLRCVAGRDSRKVVLCH